MYLLHSSCGATTSDQFGPVTCPGLCPVCATRYMLQVTCYMLHVTCYKFVSDLYDTLCATCYMLHAIFHMLHATAASNSLATPNTYGYWVRPPLISQSGNLNRSTTLIQLCVGLANRCSSSAAASCESYSLVLRHTQLFFDSSFVWFLIFLKSGFLLLAEETWILLQIISVSCPKNISASRRFEILVDWFWIASSHFRRHTVPGLSLIHIWRCRRRG